MNNSSQLSNGQPFPKKPKLDIGRQINSSTHRSSGSESSGVDIIHEIWGDEAGVAAQRKCNGDREVNMSSPQLSSSQCSAENHFDEFWGEDLDLADLEKVDFDETQALSQMPEVIKNSETKLKWVQPSESSVNNRSTQLKNKHLSVNATKNSPRVPLRRAASSGWPTASTLSFSPKNIANKNANDNNSNQPSLEQLLLENNSLKAQLTRKTGEANLIRDRLHSVEQEYDKQKKGYSDKIDSIKKEAERNCASLSKEIRSLKGQLEVKTMEMETAERRVQHMSSMNRLNSESPRSRGMLRPVFSPMRVGARQSQREDQLMCRHGQMRAKLHTFSLDFLKQLVTPELVKPIQPEHPVEIPTPIAYNPSLFSGQSSTNTCQPSTSRGNPSTSGLQQSPSSRSLSTGIEKLAISNGPSSKGLFYSSESSLESLTTILGKLSSTCPSSEPCSLSLLSPKLLDINSENTHQVITQVSESCVQILLETFQQLNMPSLSKSKRYLERLKESPQPAATNLAQTLDLLSHKELYNNERGICARRALALQSLLVEFSSVAAELILPSFTMEELKNKEIDNNETKTDKLKISDIGTSSNLGPHHLLIVIKDICHQSTIQKSRSVDGCFAAVMALLKSLLRADVSLTQQSQDLIIQILQGVVSFRPSSLVLYYILQVLLAATRYPYITASLCQNSDKCILQAICLLLQLSETPKKHVLSDLFTSWVLMLFYGNGLSSPKWLFSVPSETCCQCRPLISRQCLTMLGEACSVFPSAKVGEKKFIEKLLNRGVLIVSTLLYHDEHFGANVNPASEGHYEQFIWSMNTLSETQEIRLNEASREILESLSIQEGLRKPAYTAVDSEATHHKCNTYLRSLLLDDIHHKEVLDYLDT